MSAYRIIPVGDQALSIEFPNKIDAKVNQRVQLLARKISTAKYSGVRTVIPAYHTLLVNFDAAVTSFQGLFKELHPVVDQSLSQELPARKAWKLPVCYDEKFGPDLKDLAQFAGMSVSDVIKLHTGQTYLIYFLGFLPGFAYMAGVDKKIAMPRLAKPRITIPAGSIGIAGSQTGFYPVSSPGGWRLIGQTPLKLYHKEDPQFFYQPGDYFQFTPISLKSFEEIKKEDLSGDYQVEAVIQDE